MLLRYLWPHCRTVKSPRQLWCWSNSQRHSVAPASKSWHPQSQLGVTWTVHNQPDWLNCDRRKARFQRSRCSFRGPNIVSDHCFAAAQIRIPTTLGDYGQTSPTHYALLLKLPLVSKAHLNEINRTIRNDAKQLQPLRLLQKTLQCEATQIIVESHIDKGHFSTILQDENEGSSATWEKSSAQSTMTAWIFRRLATVGSESIFSGLKTTGLRIIMACKSSC